MIPFAPRIVCLSCAFGWGYQAERRQLAEAVRHWLPVVCSGRIEAEQLLALFRSGADGVLILGCPEGECHFQEGNHQLRKRLALLHSLMAAQGVEPARLTTFFGRDPSGERIAELVAKMAAEIRPLGPLRLSAWKGETDAG